MNNYYYNVQLLTCGLCTVYTVSHMLYGIYIYIHYVNMHSPAFIFLLCSEFSWAAVYIRHYTHTATHHIICSWDFVVFEYLEGHYTRPSSEPPPKIYKFSILIFKLYRILYVIITNLFRNTIILATLHPKSFGYKATWWRT